MSSLICSMSVSIWSGFRGMTSASSLCPPAPRALSQPSRPDYVFIFPCFLNGFYLIAGASFSYASGPAMVSLVPYLVPLSFVLFSSPFCFFPPFSLLGPFLPVFN